MPGLLLPVQRPYVHPDASLSEKSIHHLARTLALQNFGLTVAIELRIPKPPKLGSC